MKKIWRHPLRPFDYTKIDEHLEKIYDEKDEQEDLVEMISGGTQGGLIIIGLTQISHLWSYWLGAILGVLSLALFIFFSKFIIVRLRYRYNVLCNEVERFRWLRKYITESEYNTDGVDNFFILYKEFGGAQQLDKDLSAEDNIYNVVKNAIITNNDKELTIASLFVFNQSYGNPDRILLMLLETVEFNFLQKIVDYNRKNFEIEMSTYELKSKIIEFQEKRGLSSVI